MLKQRAEIRRDLDLCCGGNLAALLIKHRVNVELQPSLKHSAERLQNSAFEICVVFFVENFDQTRHAHDQANRSVCVTKKISCQTVVFGELRDQHRASKRAEDVDAGKKIGVVELAAGEQIFERYFHQHYEIIFRTIRLLQKHAAGPVQHVVRGIGNRPKTPAINPERLFVEDSGRP